MHLRIFAENNETGARRQLNIIRTSKREYNKLLEQGNPALFNKISDWDKFVNEGESLNFEPID